MNRNNPYVLFSARTLLALVFLANGFGIVDQSLAVHEMMEHGLPLNEALLLSVAGRVLEVVAGIALVLGRYQEISALALIAFLIPATLIAHPFWSAGTQHFQMQLVNFLKNGSILGGLLYVGFSAPKRPEAVKHPVLDAREPGL